MGQIVNARAGNGVRMSRESVMLNGSSNKVTYGVAVPFIRAKAPSPQAEVCPPSLRAAGEMKRRTVLSICGESPMNPSNALALAVAFVGFLAVLVPNEAWAEGADGDT